MRKTITDIKCFVRWVWRHQRGNQNLYIEEEQTTQWPKEKVQKKKQRWTTHTYKTKDRVPVTRTPLKTGVELLKTIIPCNLSFDFCWNKKTFDIVILKFRLLKSLKGRLTYRHIRCFLCIIHMQWPSKVLKRRLTSFRNGSQSVCGGGGGGFGVDRKIWVCAIGKGIWCTGKYALVEPIPSPSERNPWNENRQHGVVTISSKM